MIIIICIRGDLGIAKELGHNAHRFGIEWSRLEKEPGVWDQREWDHYKKVLDTMISLKIEPVLTLQHFTLPLWVAKNGGWLNDETIAHFSRFSEKAITELGSKVKYWITINEPLVLAFIGYLQGNWPPHKKSFTEMLQASKNMLKAHAEAYTIMKQTASSNGTIKDPMIGAAKAVATFHPCSNFSIFDRASAFLRSNFQDHSFIRSAISGKISFFPYLREKIAYKNTLDFIGLNYYFREFVHHKSPFLKKSFRIRMF